ncbi:glycoside hydrolase family 2 protein [Arachidicoccus ginsenosidimutans]|uniref:glycoside hydrolase family 2 protein n=1 Tax=Arachidicoccus sp. BS20 TaxID=1850526 RepID=UPI000B2BB29C|nr:sugar-binding domain-containing protein [Arachidicoccus sp. BS20]
MRPFISFFAIGIGCVLHSFAQPKVIMKTPFTDAAKEAVVPFPEYPRPQLERNDWMNLNGKWEYIGGKNAPDATKATAVPIFDKPETITVPYPPESYLSGIQRNLEINMWYRRTFTLPSSYEGRHVLVNFGASDYRTVVFINNKKAGMHIGGYDAFSFDITQYLQKGNNTIAVGVQDKNDGHSVSGKNSPRGGDYTYTSGIWQTVWLEPVSENYIQSIRLTPDVANKKLLVKVITNIDASVVAVASAHGKEIASADRKTNHEFSINIKDPILWSPENPFLYDLKIRLKDKSGKTTDEVGSYFGMRSVTLGTVNGVKRPLLNGKFVLQLGLLDQGYWPDGIYTAPTDEALKFDIEESKKAGFNLIRKHMKTEPQRWYYWCDKLGIMVWQDMPAIWFQDEDTAVTRSRFRHEWKEIIDEHYNAPSIVTWIPFNENWGAFDVKEITDWTKRYDPSRLVNGNTGFNNNPSYQKAYGDPGNGDFVDTHIYVGPYGASEPDGKRAASLGEFGGVGLFVRGHLYPVPNNAYDMMATKEDLTNRYILLLNQLEQLVKYNGLSAAIYTQTTDVEHEINGILTYDRAVEKMDFRKVKEINEAVIGSSKLLNN